MSQISEISENLDTPDTPQEKSNHITLEYGDIIEIHAPTNSDIHNQTFFINYIDNIHIDLINVSTRQLHQLKLSAEGNLTDESITEIELLSRADEKGYARQNGLVPKKWIDIHFGGDFPIIISGEITNLEEDMIEVTTYPDIDVIYIDFEYKGLPEKIPIKTIETRNKPAQIAKMGSIASLHKDLEEGEVWEQEKASMSQTETGEFEIKIPEGYEPDPHVRDALHSLYVDANDIIFGEEEEIALVVEVSEKEKRYSIESQVTDLMDELLSTIPNSQRTVKVLDNIHRIIERFKELRSRYSQFDTNENIKGIKQIDPNFKPLVSHIQNMDTKLKWIMPIVTLRRKLYYSKEGGNIQNEGQSDIIPISEDDNLMNQSIIQKNYLENQNQGDTAKYIHMLKQTEPYMTPFEPTTNESNLENRIEVLANIDSIVDNLGNFESTIIKNRQLAKRKFVIQRYNLGISTMEPEILKTGKRVYIRKNVKTNDPMSLKSIITLPQSIMKFSKAELPSTSIMDRTSFGANIPLLFRILKSNMLIDQHIVESFAKDINYEKMEEETKKHFLSTIKEYILDETLDNDDDKLSNFLKVIIPKSRDLIRLIRPYIQDKLSLVEIVKELEPFMVHIEDITYKEYMEIRYFINERIKLFKKQNAQNLQDFSNIRTTQYKVNLKLNEIEYILETMKHSSIFTDGYKMDYLNKRKTLRTQYDLTSSELLSKVNSIDNGQLLFNLISEMNFALYMPENLIDAIQMPEIGDMGRIEKIKANDCSRRFLTKRYSSLKDLQKDNHELDVFYDMDFDETPYDLLKKYKSNQAKMSPPDFIEFLAENLIQKHECPINMATELAQHIILGKKRVSEGEYAILEIRPQLPKDVEESSLSSSEKASIENEGNARKITHYYRRMKNTWIRDESVDETTFIDNNTLFCNMNKICFKNKSNSVCEPISDAAERIKMIARKKLLNEADDRYSKSVNEIKQDFEEKINYNINKLSKNRALAEIQLYKANNYAHELGKFAKMDDIIQSPHIALRDLILSQDDFVKRQEDICTFSTEFTRNAMEELGEDENWMYCIATNTKLFPVSLANIAFEYTSSTPENPFLVELDEICQVYGVLSDDGDSIIDKYSGYVLKKIDFSSEEGFDEQGFKINTHEIMQRDLKTIIEESLQNKDKVFENEMTQTIYNIYGFLCENLGIQRAEMEDFVLRTSLELIEKNVIKEALYEKNAEKQEKQKGKRPIPYIKYKYQTIILMISSVLLVAIQTSTPSHKPKKTAPGCVRSFSGFPYGGEEDMSGLQYIACTLYKLRSDVSPWDALKGLPQDIINKNIKKIISEYLLTRIDITDLFSKKREYLLMHPDDIIPEELSIVKWQSFLPPVVTYSVKKSLQNVSNEFKTDFLELLRNGNKDQRDSLNVFKSKIITFGYGIIEQINEIVIKKDMLLKTGDNKPFLQNACCNDKKTATMLQYFVDENPEMERNIHIIENLSKIVVDTKNLTKSSQFFHNKDTAIVRPIIPTDHFDMNIYAAFIFYCKFDRNMPVPEELRAICAECPAGYNPKWSLEEKIKFLKENGKRFTIDQLHQLMEIIYRKNIVNNTKYPLYSKVDALSELLTHLDDSESPIIAKPLIRHLQNVIDSYVPTQFLNEDTEDMRALKRYLNDSNRRMYETIYPFLNGFGNLKRSELDNLDTFIQNIMDWTIDRSQLETHTYYEEGMYSIVQYIQNSAYFMSKVFPEMILNNVEINKVPKHWSLSQFHYRDISTFMKKYYEPLNKFKKDKTILALLRDIQIQMIDVNMFIQNLPIYTPIHKKDEEGRDIVFYSLFDKEALYSLLKYIWYSILYQYIMMADNPDFLHTDVEENKKQRRNAIQKRGDIVETIATTFTPENDEEADQEIDLVEMEITTGNIQDLKTRVAELLSVFLKIDMQNKKAIDLTYSKISEKMNRSRQYEKKEITDFFRDMEKDEREVRNLEKIYKMGRWNVGMQKGLVEYDKDTYNRERGEIIERLNANMDLDIDEGIIIQRDVEDLERDAEENAIEEQDGEGMDIGGFGENYGDGDYYGDDDADDDFGREE